MNKVFIVAGTDTGIGKTTFSAMLTLGLGATYWKAIQSGTEDGTDTQTVQELTGLPQDHFLREGYVLSRPLSPHRAAELEQVEIDSDRLQPPQTSRTLIIEAAGGLLVPITRRKLQIQLFEAWQAPVILCARTGLGTINHTLLSVEALHSRNIPLHGIVFIGLENNDNIQTIQEFSNCKVLGHMPHLTDMSQASLKRVFDEGFRREDFE